MTNTHPDIEMASTLPDSGGEFGFTTDGLVAAKIVDDAYVMVPPPEISQPGGPKTGSTSITQGLRR